MAETLKVKNLFEIKITGVTFSGKHGAATLSADDNFEYSVDGDIHSVCSSLATASAVTLWDEDDDTPTTFKYLFFWCDQDVHLQLIAQATNVIIPVEALFPFTWGGGAFATAARGGSKILAAASTTAITDGTTTLSQIDSIVLGNSSGNTCNYVFHVVD